MTRKPKTIFLPYKMTSDKVKSRHMQQISFLQIWVVMGLLMTMPEPVTAQDDELTLDDLFATPKLTGITPSKPVWAPDSEHFAFSWSEPGNPKRGLWLSTSDGKDVRLISDTASAPVRDMEMRRT
ncbi:MAG: hypothetical protein HRU12_12565, partial [Phaeodactylibacter sp.]|nr:hypothetical protein [Phaeodactylibacter sp.]